MSKVCLGLVMRNEVSRLEECLTCILAESNREGIGEILVYDNASTDHSVALVRSTLENYKIPHRIFEGTENNMGLARQWIVSNSQFRLVLFVDADCRVPENWIKNFLHQYEIFSNRPLLLGLQGGCLLRSESRLLGSLFRWLNLPHPFGGAQMAKQERSLDHLATSNALFDRDAVLSVGNFSEHFASVGEDLELGLRAKRLGYSMFCVPGVEVEHHCRTTLAQWMLRLLKFGSIQPRAVLSQPAFWLLHRFWLVAGVIVGGLFLIFYTKETLLISFIFSLGFALVSRGSLKWREAPLRASLIFMSGCSYSLGILWGVFVRGWRRRFS